MRPQKQTTNRTINILAILAFFLLGGILLPLQADDLVRIETLTDSAWSEFGVSGDGVIIAILDRGIDYEHPDFLNPDGSTRILYIFDMIDNSGVGDPDNTYGVGTIYDEGEINAALSSGVRLATRDAVGHGTATAGAAGGNGAASNGMYAGIAPNASLIIVKITTEGAPAHGNEPAEAPFYNPSYIPIGIDFVLDKATEAGMPVVMLANFGSVGGPMDGTSELSREIDSRFGPGIPGRVFVSGSSDDGGIDNHAAATIAQGQSIDLQIAKIAGNLRLNLWYDDNDRFDVEIITPTTTYGPYASPFFETQRDQRFTAEFNYYHNGSAIDFFNADNNKREILIDFIGQPGNYILRLTGATISDGSFHASLNPANILHGANTNRFTSHVVPGHTIWDMASAHYNIVPNSYVLRQNWVDLDGVTRTATGNGGGPGTLWTGSGIGPTYDGRLGMTVSAPGNSNITTYAPRSWFGNFRHVQVQGGNGLYGILGAVSGASPMVTGIIALMLEADSSLDASQVKTILQNSARADGFTGTVPNTTWGYGKVNAHAAVAEVLSMTAIDNPELPVSGGFELFANYPNPFNPETVIRYSLPVSSSVTLEIYDVMGRRIRQLVGNEQMAVQQSPGNYSIIWDARNDAGAAVSTGVYLYRLQAGQFSQSRKMLLVR